MIGFLDLAFILNDLLWFAGSTCDNLVLIAAVDLHFLSDELSNRTFPVIEAFIEFLLLFYLKRSKTHDQCIK